MPPAFCAQQGQGPLAKLPFGSFIGGEQKPGARSSRGSFGERVAPLAEQWGASHNHARQGTPGVTHGGGLESGSSSHMAWGPNGGHW